MKQCNKKLLICFINILFLASLFSADINIMVAPFISFDSLGETEEFVSVNKILVKDLHKFPFDGLIDFHSLDLTQTGKVMSVLDAARLCQNSDIEYLLFGFISRNEKTINSELRLYDYNQKKIIKFFFAQDESKELERLLATQEKHIVEYLGKETGTDPTAIAIEENQVFISLPVTIGYWTFTENGWHSHLDGIIKVDAGVAFYPSFLTIPILNRELYFSVSLTPSFKYAKGNEIYYPANFFSIGIALLANVHFDFAKQHTVKFGVGPLYECEIMQITLKYSDAKTYSESNMGMQFDLGWAYKLNDLVSLNVTLQSGVFFYKNNPFWFAVNLGTNFSFKRNEKVKLR